MKCFSYCSNKEQALFNSVSPARSNCGIWVDPALFVSHCSNLITQRNSYCRLSYYDGLGVSPSFKLLTIVPFNTNWDFAIYNVVFLPITVLFCSYENYITVDNHLTLNSHINSNCKRGSLAIRNIGRIRKYLNQADCKKLVHSFVTSRLDSCNSILCGLPESQISKLQRIQNTAARLVTKTKKSNLITPVLRQLHWLQESNTKFLLSHSRLLMAWRLTTSPTSSNNTVQTSPLTPIRKSELIIFSSV